MFEDEARFGRINAVRRCWAPSQVRPSVGRQIVREYTYAYGAVSPHDGVFDSLIIPETRAEDMSFFLREVSSRHQKEFVLIVMDKAGWHIAKALQLPTNIGLIFLPPYSPELNPVEHVWDEVREKCFGNEVFKSLDAVEDQLVKGLVELENNSSRIASITGFNWIVSTKLKAN